MPWKMAECPQCEGHGGYEETVGMVSKDMASDAGEPAMEGQAIVETTVCDFCNGAGEVMNYRRQKFLTDRETQ